MIHRLVSGALDHGLVVALAVVGVTIAGFVVAPFEWDSEWLPRDPVPVDAIPDLGENQQIVFTTWPGRSPQDVEDQLTVPLTVQLQGLPGVRTVRSFSYFGFSTIYVIFEEDVEFYWSRSRILEKLNSSPAERCPRVSRRRSGRTPPRWGRCTGTRWRAATRTAARPVAGIRRNSAPSRTSTCATRWRPCRAWPRSRRWAASCASTRSTWIPRRCASPA